MAHHRYRAKVRSADGQRVKSVLEDEAWEMLRTGRYIQISTDTDLAHGHPLEIEAIGRKNADPSKARTITAGESQSNAAAAVGKFTNDARLKVRNWARCYRPGDYRAVTATAGRIFIPDSKAARERAASLAR